MSDPTVHDDAPAVTSKQSKPARSLLAQAVTIDRPAQELFDYWRDFSNLAQFMENIIAIEVRDNRRSHWTVKAPAGKTVEWDALVTHEVPGREISWQSAEGADVANSGKVEFKGVPGRGTVVTVTIAYDPPAGVVGKLVAKVFQREPNIQARQDLRRFKQLMETGEIATNARNRAMLARGRELMRALVWHGKHDVRVDTVDDPEIVNPRDCVILKVTSTAICGSDLHLYDHYIPSMQSGDILGHEFMGEVVEVGAKVDTEKGAARRRSRSTSPAAVVISARRRNSPRATTATRRITRTSLSPFMARAWRVSSATAT